MNAVSASWRVGNNASKPHRVGRSAKTYTLVLGEFVGGAELGTAHRAGDVR